MDENKNQTPSTVPDGIVVKDYDGNFKVLNDGELKDLDALLSATQSIGGMPEISTVNAPQGGALDFPKFTDLALVPQDEHFQIPELEKKQGEAAVLHFHPDDKAEVERELEKLNTVFGLSSQKQYSISKIAQKLVDKHGLKLSEQDFISYTKIVLSYFRQARSLVETRAKLSGSKQNGGIGISADTVDHMIAVLKHLKQKIEDTDGIVVEADESSLAQVEEVVIAPKPEVKKNLPPVQSPKPVKAEAPPVTQKQMPEIRKEEMPNMPEITVQPEPKPAPPPPVQQVPTPIQPIPKPEPQKVETPSMPAFVPPQVVPQEPIPVKQEYTPAPPPPEPVKVSPQATPAAEETPKINRPQIPSFKPPMIEIRRPQVNAVRSGKPTGRVDELALMDMATWRMLDPDPRIRAGKILGKIQNLEQESLTRKSQGVQAWRSNEVYQYYLMIGQMSLEHKKEVAEVIQSLASEGRETLTLEEFEAVSDLNRMLRF